MSEVGELYLVVVVLFVLESFYIIENSTLALRKRFLESWKWAGFDSRSILSLRTMIFAWSGVSPLAKVLFAQTQPICICIDGVVGFPVHTLTGLPAESSSLFLSWGDAAKIARDGKKLYFGKKLLARFSSEHAASTKLQQLLLLASELPTKREAAIRVAIATELDAQKAEEKRVSLYCQFRDERVLNCVTAAYLLVLFPIVTIFGWFALHWYELLAILLILCAATAVLHSLNSSKFGKVPLSSVVSLVLFPVSSCRSVQKYIAFALADFHPLAVAKNILGSGEFLNRFSEVVRDLQYPQGTSMLDELTKRRVLECRQRYLTEILKLAAEWKIAAPITAPVKERTLIAYCPRCLQQYMRPTGQCADCVGIDLIQFNTLGAG
jgi:hypothetical protein